MHASATHDVSSTTEANPPQPSSPQQPQPSTPQHPSTTTTHHTSAPLNKHSPLQLSTPQQLQPSTHQHPSTTTTLHTPAPINNHNPPPQHPSTTTTLHTSASVNNHNPPHTSTPQQPQPSTPQKRQTAHQSRVGPSGGWSPVGGAEASAPSWVGVARGWPAGAGGRATGATGALVRARWWPSARLSVSKRSWEMFSVANSGGPGRGGACAGTPGSRLAGVARRPGNCQETPAEPARLATGGGSRPRRRAHPSCSGPLIPARGCPAVGQRWVFPPGEGRLLRLRARRGGGGGLGARGGRRRRSRRLPVPGRAPAAVDAAPAAACSRHRL